MAKRKLDILVISDTHLGTYGCRAKELVNYLKTVQPKMLILNGDIIDIWQFKKNYFPKEHIEVIRQVLKKAAAGTQVYYITGNHDDAFRRFSGFSVGNFHLEDRLLLNIDNKKAWIFHGDVFDASIKCSRWLAKLGGYTYDWLITLNVFINYILSKLGKPKMSFSKKVKNSVKKAVKYIGDFEETAAAIAIDRAYDFVICGHIHTPQNRKIANSKGQTQYLNSGDWIENLSALEYTDGQWNIYSYEQDYRTKDTEPIPESTPNIEAIMEKVLAPTELKIGTIHEQETPNVEPQLEAFIKFIYSQN